MFAGSGFEIVNHTRGYFTTWPCRSKGCTSLACLQSRAGNDSVDGTGWTGRLHCPHKHRLGVRIPPGAIPCLVCYNRDVSPEVS